MLKQYAIGLTIVLLWSNLIHAQNTKIQSTTTYDVSVQAMNSDCIFSINDTEIVRLTADKNQRLIKVHHRLTNELYNGSNRLQLDFKPILDKAPATLGRNKKRTNEEKKYINQQCIAEITGSRSLEEWHVAGIAFTINNNYKISTKDLRFYPNLSAIKVQKTADGFLRATRAITLTNLPKRHFDRAQTYIDTPENRKQLEKRYQELWQMFNERNFHQVEQLYQYAIEDTANIKGMSKQQVFQNLNIEQNIDRYQLSLRPLDFTHFQLALSENGKLVRLVREENGKTISPIVFYSPHNNDLFSIQPSFSLFETKLMITK